jgi:hypothetical protein
MTRKQYFLVCLFSGIMAGKTCKCLQGSMFAKECFYCYLVCHLQKTCIGNNVSGMSIFQKQIWEIMSPLKFFLYCPGHKKRSEQIKHSYQSLHHVHSSLSHRTHLSKNIDRIDDTFLKFIKDRIYSKEDASSANTSTRK